MKRFIFAAANHAQRATDYLHGVTGQAGHLREGAPEVGRKPVDHLGTAALASFTGKDVSADLPIERHELTVDRKGRAAPSVGDAMLQLRHERDVTLSVRSGGIGHRPRRTRTAFLRGRLSARRPVTLRPPAESLLQRHQG
jgi:hypothetical protein